MSETVDVAIIGTGPAGLIAADHLSRAGLSVTVFERMPSPARKFLLAGRGGLNITHSEPLDIFLTRYGAARDWLEPAIRAFPPSETQALAASLGEACFTGTSGRVFPKSFKATPLLRAWLRRLAAQGVTFRLRHTWTGWDGPALRFTTPDGEVRITARATLLALGGASWPRLGSDGGWTALLAQDGIPVTPLAPANVGVRIAWSAPFLAKFEGVPLKAMTFRCGGMASRAEAVVAQTGLEGGAIYALSGAIREGLHSGAARLSIDLKPDMTQDALIERLQSARGRDSLTNILRKHVRLSPVAIGLFREACGNAPPADVAAFAGVIKAADLPVAGISPLDRAISSAGGIRREGVGDDFMLAARPGVFVAGEMLDWEAPTGGYLLQACLATGAAAARGIAARLGL